MSNAIHYRAYEFEPGRPIEAGSAEDDLGLMLQIARRKSLRRNISMFAVCQEMFRKDGETAILSGIVAIVFRDSVYGLLDAEGIEQLIREEAV
jgi:hypothetical protein